MADNHQSPNGHTPFRRYEPPAKTETGNVARLPRSQSTPARPPLAPGAARRQRQARSRWRQWIQSANSASGSAPAKARSGAPTPTSPGSQSPDSRAATASKGTPRSQAPAAHPASQLPKIQYRQSATPPPSPPATPNPHSSAPAPPPSPRSQSPQRQDNQRWPQRPQPQPVQPRQRTNNKVTPIHRQPVWSSPASPTAPNEAGRRDRKPRRPTRKAPRPVLYGIRLLILGTGVAAIAGTVLSSLNPQREATVSDSSGDERAGLAVSPVRPQRADAALSQPLPLSQELVAVETDLVALESMTPGLSQSVFFYDLETGNYIDINGTTAVSAASTIKVPILVAFLQAVDAGSVSLDQAVTLREDMIASGSGDMQVHELGTQYTALEVATEMIVNSDNTATNLMIELLGGLDALNEQFRSWGLESTILRNLLPDLDGTNTTSTADLVRVMTLVDQGQLLSMRSRDRLFSIMQRTYNRSLIPDGLGDAMALTYNKTGDIGTTLGDVALVDATNGNRYILGVLVERPFNDGRANELVRRVSGRVHEEMNQPVSPVGGNATGADSAPTEADEPLDPTAEDASPEPVPANIDVDAEVVPYVMPDSTETPVDPVVPPG